MRWLKVLLFGPCPLKDGLLLVCVLPVPCHMHGYAACTHSSAAGALPLPLAPAAVLTSISVAHAL